MSGPTTRISRGRNMLKADVGSWHAAMALFAAARLVWSPRPKGASGTSIKSRPAFAKIVAFSIGPHQPSFMASSSFDEVGSPDLYHVRASPQRVSPQRYLREATSKKRSAEAEKTVDEILHSAQKHDAAHRYLAPARIRYAVASP